MGNPATEQVKRSRAWKKKRVQWLERVFGYREVESDRSIVNSFQLTGHEVDLIDQLREAQRSHLWKYLPDDVLQYLLDGNLRYDQNEIKKADVNMVSNKGIVLMGLRCLFLYLLGASPYNGALLRKMYQVDGKEMNKEAVRQRVNRGRLYSQIEELGGSVGALTDDDFEFDEDDWD